MNRPKNIVSVSVQAAIVPQDGEFVGEFIVQPGQAVVDGDVKRAAEAVSILEKTMLAVCGSGLLQALHPARPGKLTLSWEEAA